MFEWDPETNGYILMNNTTEKTENKEIRPVYASELDTLGFGEYWQYPRDASIPLAWASRNTYYYCGEKVATIRKASYDRKPELIIHKNDLTLSYVDVPTMCKKNEEILNKRVSETINRIRSVYETYHNQYDLICVAFSGGKDSTVTLDLVHRALPNTAYIVLFGDTGMESSDTYAFVHDIQRKYSDIVFHTCSARIPALATWELLGPPSRRIRWCCAVHKTSPQTIFLRNYLGKTDIHTLAFTGIRATESASRSKYEQLNIGNHQDTYHPILTWSSAELYLYILSQNLLMNKAYKKGCSRVGCLVCPLSTGKNTYIKMQNYPDEMEKYLSIIENTSSRPFNHEQMRKYINDHAWPARCNGRDLKIEQNLVSVEKTDISLILHAKQVKSNDWQNWMRIIGNLKQDSDEKYCIITPSNDVYHFTAEQDGKDDLRVELILHKTGRKEIQFLSKFKIVFRKAAYCIRCGVCEAICPYGCINMKSGTVISSECNQCGDCLLKLHNGCWRYESIRLPAKSE